MTDPPQQAFVRARLSKELLADDLANFNARDLLVYRLRCFFEEHGLHMFWWRMFFEPIPDWYDDGYGDVQVTVMGRGVPS